MNGLHDMTDRAVPHRFLRSACANIVLAGIFIFTVVGCQPAPSEQSAPVAVDVAAKVEPDATLPWWQQVEEKSIVRPNIEPPSEVDPQLVTPYGLEQMQVAQTPLDVLLAEFKRPSFLPASPDDTRKKLKEPSDEALAAYGLGRSAWLIDRRSSEARKQLELANRLSPNQPQFLAMLGDSYAASGNMVRASKYLEKSVKLNPLDVNSLCHLGRYLDTQGKWQQAARTYAYALSLKSRLPYADKTYWPLLHFQLAGVLKNQQYDLAAIEQLWDYLQASDQFQQTIHLFRERMFLYRQRAVTCRDIGDALNRLGKPSAALIAYTKAAQLGISDQSSLVARIAYSHLKTGNDAAVLEITAAMLEQGDADDVVFNLVKYLQRHDVDMTAFGSNLQAVYDKRGESAALAVAIADLMEFNQAVSLLQTHLGNHPTDRLVYEKLISRLVSAADDQAANQALAVRQTVSLINTNPSVTRRYIDILIKAFDDPQQLITQLDQLLQSPSPDQALITLIRAMAYQSAGNMDAALTDYQAAVQLDATLGIARIELANQFIARQQLDQAEAVLAPIADSGDSSVAMLRARLHIAREDIPAALKIVDDALESDTRNIDLLLLKAKLHQFRGENTAAETTCLEALYAHPRNEQIYEFLFRLYEKRELENWQKQWQWLIEKAMQTIPTANITQLKYASLLIAQQNYDEARPILLKLYENNPDDREITRALLSLYVASDQKQQARELLEIVLAAHPDDAKTLEMVIAWYKQLKDPRWAELERRLILLESPGELRDTRLAVHYQSQNQHDKIVDVLGKTLKGDCEKPQLILAILGQSLVELKRTDQLEQYYLPAIDKYSDVAPRLNLQLAMHYLDSDQPAKAIAPISNALIHESDVENINLALSMLSRAVREADQPGRMDQLMAPVLERYPDQEADILFHWAAFLERVGEAERGEQMFLDLLEKYPDHAMANNTLGYLYANSDRNLLQARAMITRAVDQEPDEAAYLDSLGWAEYKLGNFDLAYKWLRRAWQEGGSEYPVILDHLGDTMYKLDRKDRARRHWQKALDLLPEQDPESDRELVGLDKRLQAKLDALDKDQPAPVATSPGPPK